MDETLRQLQRQASFGNEAAQFQLAILQERQDGEAGLFLGALKTLSKNAAWREGFQPEYPLFTQKILHTLVNLFYNYGPYGDPNWHVVNLCVANIEDIDPEEPDEVQGWLESRNNSTLYCLIVASTEYLTIGINDGPVVNEYENGYVVIGDPCLAWPELPLPVRDPCLAWPELPLPADGSCYGNRLPEFREWTRNFDVSQFDNFLRISPQIDTWGVAPGSVETFGVSHSRAFREQLPEDYKKGLRDKLTIPVSLLERVRILVRGGYFEQSRKNPKKVDLSKLEIKQACPRCGEILYPCRCLRNISRHIKRKGTPESRHNPHPKKWKKGALDKEFNAQLPDGYFHRWRFLPWTEDVEGAQRPTYVIIPTHDYLEPPEVGYDLSDSQDEIEQQAGWPFHGIRAVDVGRNWVVGRIDYRRTTDF